MHVFSQQLVRRVVGIYDEALAVYFDAQPLVGAEQTLPPSAPEPNAIHADLHRGGL